MTTCTRDYCPRADFGPHRETTLCALAEFGRAWRELEQTLGYSILNSRFGQWLQRRLG